MIPTPTPDELGPIGPIMGDNECEHEFVRYYDSPYHGDIYAVCGKCAGHFWDVKIPEDAKIIELES